MTHQNTVGGPFRHLLVAVDGSDNAMRAATVAGEIAHRFDSQITLLSVYRHVSYTNRHYTQLRVGPIDAENPVALSLKSIAQDNLEQAFQLLAEIAPLRIDSLLRRGSTAATILSVCEELQVDCIVMGCRGRGELESLLLGSVSHKVNALAKSTCITVR
jgi:nucleotide-binding universal stress UspA family protein